MMLARSLEVGFADAGVPLFVEDEVPEVSFQSSSIRIATATRRARDLLLGDPSLRPLSASAVAHQTGLPLASVQAAIASIAKSAAGGQPMKAIPPGASLDTAIMLAGAPGAPVPNANAGGRRHIAIRPFNRAGFDALVRAVPALAALPEDKLVLISGVDFAGGEASGIDPSNPAIYIVEAGDFPSKIAQKLTGDQSRWKELVAANVPPKSKDPNTGNFTSLFAGEKLKLPASWVVSAPSAPPAPGLPSPAPAPQLPGGALVQWDYIVQPGDFPFKVAQTITGNGGRWTELKAANPQKALQGPGDAQPGNFKTFFAGEKIHLPDSWAQFAATVPPPAGVVPRLPAGVPVPPGLPPVPPTATPPAPGPAIPVPPIPPVPGLPAPPGFELPPGQVAVPVPGLPGVTADAGVYAQAQALLAAWTKFRPTPPPASPSDFGTFPGEFTGSETPRSKQSLASYQAWANVNKGAGLRTDGVLDTATYLSLTVTVGELLAARPGGGAGTTPAPKKGGGGDLIAIGGLVLGGLTLLK